MSFLAGLRPSGDRTRRQLSRRVRPLPLRASQPLPRHPSPPLCRGDSYPQDDLPAQPRRRHGPAGRNGGQLQHSRSRGALGRAHQAGPHRSQERRRTGRASPLSAPCRTPRRLSRAVRECRHDLQRRGCSRTGVRRPGRHPVSRTPPAPRALGATGKAGEHEARGSRGRPHHILRGRPWRPGFDSEALSNERDEPQLPPRGFQGAGWFSAREYLLRRRIARAKELLAFSQLSIKEVGSEVAMPDPHYFNKQFRRLAGMSPTEYRRG
ncbi:MAG: helix-turn-helix domain-containing protein [Candidatus Competibacteraceae bacterium]|nr:helix-turn-helix domain-containing protein [Candidatus Competibacteraceae bacterium]